MDTASTFGGFVMGTTTAETTQTRMTRTSTDLALISRVPVKGCTRVLIIVVFTNVGSVMAKMIAELGKTKIRLSAVI
jgi:pheromone shutdown protein TraB